MAKAGATSKEKPVQDDEDSSDDSDYDPNDEVDKSDAENEDGEDAPLQEISTSRKRRMKELFDELQGSEQRFVKAKVETSAYFGKVKATKADSKNRKKPKTFHMMATIFGKSKARDLLSIPSSCDADAASSAAVAGEVSQTGSASISSAALELAQKVQRKVTVVDTKKFAGKNIEVKRTVMGSASASSSSAAASSSSKKKAGGALDQVLAEIQGPKVISTVSKSSYDWDNFKEQENLVDDLTKVTKGGGYLTKKDFLDRCDVRSFEMERDERQRKAVQAGASSTGGGGGGAM